MQYSPHVPEPSDRSWWLQEALRNEGDLPDSASLDGSVTVDVAIVGGGFVGLWTALVLKERRPELSIALAEAEICGAGASGKNGGKAHGYWASLGSNAATLGEDGALEIARAGTWAQDAIRSFAATCGRDLWWRDGGNLIVSAAPAQDHKIELILAQAKRLGASDHVVPLGPDEVRVRCASPVFRSGLFYPEAATVQPARLVRALRETALRHGVTIFERTRMTNLDLGSPNRVRTPGGELIAKEVVLATNAALAGRPEIGAHVSVFSSHAVMSEPAPDRLEAMSWTGEEGFADLRMFLHYFRKTPDGRVLMGSGSGPLAYRGSLSTRLTHDRSSVARAAAGLRRLLPAFANTNIAAAWGGPIDVSSDRLPIFKTLAGTRVHYACGFSGHGVNATHIAGQCLASLVLGEKDQWSSLPFCTRDPPRLPPEPIRYLGGAAIRRAILACEEAEENEARSPVIARAIAGLPKRLGLRIGVR